MMNLLYLHLVEEWALAKFSLKFKVPKGFSQLYFLISPDHLDCRIFFSACKLVQEDSRKNQEMRVNLSTL